MRSKVVIVGAGFAGLNTALYLKKANVDVLVIDKTNHHLFQPLLYQVASAALAPSNISSPIRQVLYKQKNASVIMGAVSEIDKEKRNVVTSDGASFNYDYLVLAPGTRQSYFGKDEWEEFAPGLKTLTDAIRIRENVLMAFERAERSESPSEIAKYLRFVIVGGGPTGVEMAGAVAEIARKTLFFNFRRIKPEQSEVYLIEGGPQILPSYSAHLAGIAKKDLEKMGVKVLLNTTVTDVTQDGVKVGTRFIETSNVVWAAGNQASPLLKTLKVPLDRQGRVIVDSDLSIPGFREVFVIGDAAAANGADGRPLPGLAPVAIQEGRYVANVIRDELKTKALKSAARQPFQYFDKGNMATIGKAKAVVQVGKLEFTGFAAWLTWCFIHILYLITYTNRLFVMMQWFFSYVTGRSSVRLITRSVHDPSEPDYYGSGGIHIFDPIDQNRSN